MPSSTTMNATSSTSAPKGKSNGLRIPFLFLFLMIMIVTNVWHLKSQKDLTNLYWTFYQSTDSEWNTLPNLHNNNNLNNNNNKNNNKTLGNHMYPFTFSACMLTKDDNLLLPEWIAYHYTVLPLRHLILAVDPLSITSPMSIIKEYRKYLPDLTIEVWAGNSYYHDGPWWKQKFENFDPYNHSAIHALTMHRQRQKAFYTKCLQQLKKQNQTWAVLIDTDEYFTFNSILPMEKHKHGYNESNAKERGSLRYALPNKIGKQNETISHFVDKDTTIKKSQHTSCFTYPRLFFSAKESKYSNDVHQQNHSLTFTTNTSTTFIPALHSLSFTAHVDAEGGWLGKSMINLQRYDGQHHVENVHRTFNSRCETYGSFKRNGLASPNLLFRIHHYTDSLDVFLTSPRRTVEQWEYRNKFDINGYDDSLSNWYMEFEDLIGNDSAAWQLTTGLQISTLKHLQQIKYRVEVLNETIPYVFNYDKPGDPLQVF